MSHTGEVVSCILGFFFLGWGFEVCNCVTGSGDGDRKSEAETEVEEKGLERDKRLSSAC